MPVWGDGTKWGVKKWGSGDLSASQTLERRLISGPMPWEPDFDYQVGRSACFEVWSVDPVTMLNDVQIESITDGSVSGSVNGWHMEENQLSFTALDPSGAFYTTGPMAGLVDRNSLIRVTLVVGDAPDTITRHIRLFRTTTEPDFEDADGAQVTVRGEDWLRTPLRQYLNVVTSQPGVGPTLASLRYANAAALAGAPFPTGLDTYAALVYALFWRITDSTSGDVRVHVHGDMPAPVLPDEEDLVSKGVDLFRDPFAPNWTVAEYLAFLDDRMCPFVAYYDGNGHVHLRRRKGRSASMGYVSTCDDAVIGRIAIPVESLTRNLTEPTYSAVYVYHVWEEQTEAAETPIYPPYMGGTGGAQPGAGTGGTGGTPLSPAAAEATVQTKIIIQPGASSESTKIAWPHDVLGKGEAVYWRGAPAVEHGLYDEFARSRLQGYLEASDRISIQVDSAFPIPPMQESVRFHHTDRELDGWYRLDGFSIPLTEAPAQWQLLWESDGD